MIIMLVEKMCANLIITNDLLFLEIETSRCLILIKFTESQLAYRNESAGWYMQHHQLQCR